MEKIYRETRLLRTCDCDVNGQWRPSAILETMQETGGAHSGLWGAGRSDLLSMDLVWIVTRVEVVMDRYPHIGESITTETFPMPTRRWFFPRYYIFRTEDGETVGRAGSLWALLDLNTRHMSSPDPVLALMPDNSDLLAPLGLPGPVTEVSGTLEAAEAYPLYTDLDVNLHVNNTRYIDWCCNALGVETMQAKQFRTFSINYDSELKAGEMVRTELRRFMDAFSYAGFHGSRRCFDIGGELVDRPSVKA